MSKREELAQAVLAIMKDSGPAGAGFTVKFLRTVLQKSRDPIYDALLFLERDGKVRRDSTRGLWQVIYNTNPSVASLLEASRQSGPVISRRAEDA
jgi:hypothetical protein